MSAAQTSKPRLLLIDNYDSFTYNLVQAFMVLGADVLVHRNDQITIDQARALAPTHLCISPGPGTPHDAGVSMAMIEAFAGELEPMHEAACAAAQRFAMRSVPRRFDVVVTSNSGYPLDQNLYQAVKGMSAAAKVVKPGGLIVCAAECRDGFPGHGSYRRLLESSGGPREFLRAIAASDHVTPDQWQVQIQANIQDHARVVMHTEHLSDDELGSVHLSQTRDITATVAAEGDGATVCVLPEGPQTIAYVG